MATKRVSGRSILDAALKLAEKSSWEAVRLYDVAKAMKVDLNDIRRFYSEKEDLSEAWFDLADEAMLKTSKSATFKKLETTERIHRLIMSWLTAMSKHRRVTKEIIYGKLEFGHLHVQIPALLRVSRTVQWVREAANRDATFMERAIEETGLTTIFLATVAFWMYDHSKNSVATSQFLKHRLEHARDISHLMQQYIYAPCQKIFKKYGQYQ